MQQWLALSDPAMEEVLYDMQSMRQLAGLSLSRGGIPDETTRSGQANSTQAKRLTKLVSRSLSPGS